MARELERKVAVVTGAASGIGLASAEAMLALGARVVMVDRDEAALKALCKKHGEAAIPLLIDLLDPKDCASLLPRTLEKAGQIDILHANAGTYIGGDLLDVDTGAHRPDAELERQRRDEERARRTAAHDRASDGRHHRHEFLGGPFSGAMGAGVFSVEMGGRLLCPDGATSSVQARHSGGFNLAWPRHHRPARGLAAGEAEGSQELGSLLEAGEVANVITFMLTRPRGMTIRDVVMLPTNFDL